MSSSAHRLWVVLVLSVIVLTACQQKRPAYVLSDDEMVDVLCDYHKAKAMGDELPAVETHMKVLFVESALAKHGLTQADFDTTLTWFSRHPDVLTDVYEQVTERLKTERDALGHLMSLRNQQPSESPEGDTVDVWPGQRVHRLSRHPLNNKITFALESDANYRDSDTLQWIARFTHTGQGVDSLHAAVMALHIAYSRGDTTLTAMRRIYSDGPDTLTLSADTLGTLLRIEGFIYLPMVDSTDHARLLVDGLMLIRRHATADSATIDSLSARRDEAKGDTVITVVGTEVDTPADTTATAPATKRPAARTRPTANSAAGRTATTPAPSKAIKTEADKKATTKKATVTKKTTKKSTTKKTSTTTPKTTPKRAPVTREVDDSDAIE